MAQIDAFFKLMNDEGASDLHMVAGQQPILRIRGDMERVKFSPTESESKVLSCSQLEAWKEVWDKPWILCEIFATCQDEGFMEGVNPKLKWHKHVERDGAKGLARGAAYPCTIGLKLTD